MYAANVPSPAAKDSPLAPVDFCSVVNRKGPDPQSKRPISPRRLGPPQQAPMDDLLSIRLDRSFLSLVIIRDGLRFCPLRDEWSPIWIPNSLPNSHGPGPKDHRGTFSNSIWNRFYYQEADLFHVFDSIAQDFIDYTRLHPASTQAELDARVTFFMNLQWAFRGKRDIEKKRKR
ncbi:hypothetical protein VP01_990g8 [Puccinia sorghi]|uniref:Uncharacterized protein n=1 Tax=Puccinia sorghi TaxID=27349 RepID=A0A0L6U7G3_9BASI|nr:hypothetical protein VP01_990g8 [Puccinia sorghi]